MPTRPTTALSSVDAYIAAQPATTRGALERVRRAILGALPGAEEAISYRMPVYKVDGTAVLYFAAWARHYSLYPASDRLVAAFGDDLAGCEISKGTIRFPLAEPVPVKLIGRIARFRAREVAERTRVTPTPARPTRTARRRRTR